MCKTVGDLYSKSDPIISKMLNYKSTKVGMKIKIPVMPDDKILEGEVIYVNPKNGFCRLKFEAESGDKFIESFRMYNLPKTCTI